ncbi:MAG: TonB-dependent receptor plug domain-containing protein [Marinobacter sp.]
MFKCLSPVFLTGLSLFAVAPVAMSQQSADTDTLEPILVTAPLGPRTIAEGLSSVTTIDETEIRRQQPRQFSELLRAQPGVTVQTGGGVAQQTSVYTRGHESDATVLLVNGIRIRAAASGIPAWEFVPAQLVNHVDIVRSGRSSLYGADAMGGVVQVFTTPQEYGRHGWVEAGAGNLGTQEYGAGLSAVDDKGSLNIGLAHSATDGAPVIEGGKDKASDNTAGTFNASREFDNGVRLDLTYLGAEGNVEYEGGDKDFRFQTAGLGVDIPVNDFWRTSLQFSDARDEQTYFSEFGTSDVDSQTRTSRLENWFVAGVHEFVVGAEVMDDRVSGSDSYLEDSRRNDAFFGQALLNFGPADVHLSARSDDNEAFGSHETWGGAFGYQLGDGYRISLSTGTSYITPSFNDLYSPWGGANPDLEPEEAISYEAALERQSANWFWKLALFRSDVENLIVSAFPAPSFNADEAKLQGAELEAGWASNGWSAKAAVSIGDFEDKETGEPLPFRPEQTARVDLDKEFDRFYVGTSLIAENHKYERNGTTRIPGYANWDLRTGAKLLEKLSIDLAVNNVLDKEGQIREYQDGVNYITAGRTFTASVRYEFGL